jgi:hypothetical protein
VLLSFRRRPRFDPPMVRSTDRTAGKTAAEAKVH